MGKTEIKTGTVFYFIISARDDFIAVKIVNSAFVALPDLNIIGADWPRLLSFLNIRYFDFKFIQAFVEDCAEFAVIQTILPNVVFRKSNNVAFVKLNNLITVKEKRDDVCFVSSDSRLAVS